MGTLNMGPLKMGILKVPHSFGSFFANEWGDWREAQAFDRRSMMFLTG